MGTLEDKNIELKYEHNRYKYELQFRTGSAGCVSIVKTFNTGPDVRDQVTAALTIRIDELKDMLALIEANT